MVVIDLGTRIIKVNQSLLRKDIDPHRNTEVPPWLNDTGLLRPGIRTTPLSEPVATRCSSAFAIAVIYLGTLASISQGSAPAQCSRVKNRITA